MNDPHNFAERLSGLQREASKFARQRRARLATGIRRATPHVPHMPKVADRDEIHAWLEELTGELETHLEEAAVAAKEGLRQHPIITVAAAFALGIIIGRLSK
jgi:hypothetical protein